MGNYTHFENRIIEETLRDISRSLALIVKELHKMNAPLDNIKPVQITLDTKPKSDNPYQE